MDGTRIGEIYGNIGQVAAYIVGALTFIGCYLYCIAAYGFLFGLGLGWMPSLIAAFIAGNLAFLFWPLLLVAILGLAALLLR